VALDVVGAAVQAVVLQKLLIDILVLRVGRRPLTIGAALSIKTDKKFANEWKLRGGSASNEPDENVSTGLPPTSLPQNGLDMMAKYRPMKGFSVQSSRRVGMPKITKQPRWATIRGLL